MSSVFKIFNFKTICADGQWEMRTHLEKLLWLADVARAARAALEKVVLLVSVHSLPNTTKIIYITRTFLPHTFWHWLFFFFCSYRSTSTRPQDTSLGTAYATSTPETISGTRKTRIQTEKLPANITFYFRMVEFKMYDTLPMMMASKLMLHTRVRRSNSIHEETDC